VRPIVSAAVRKLLARVAREKALLFAPLVPNAVTVVSLMEARRDNLATLKSIDALMADLHADH
jgi:antitoxin component of RelBE/YafQ-DinJ toxin-antitoxin module